MRHLGWCWVRGNVKIDLYKNFDKKSPEVYSDLGCEFYIPNIEANIPFFFCFLGLYKGGFSSLILALLLFLK